MNKKNIKQGRKKSKLKPFNSIIQICPICNKIDVYLNDMHNCNAEKLKQENLNYYD